MRGPSYTRPTGGNDDDGDRSGQPRPNPSRVPPQVPAEAALHLPVFGPARQGQPSPAPRIWGHAAGWSRRVGHPARSLV